MKTRTTFKATSLSLALLTLSLVGTAIFLAINPHTMSASPAAPAPDGSCTTLFSESFDGVPAPVLPQGWTSVFTAGPATCTQTGTCNLATNWVTGPTADTGPNAVFHDDPSCVTNSTLDTPFINPIGAPMQLIFRNSYNLESTFDGGVLEISTAAGGFQDVLTAGGSFSSGGYNGTISTGFLSPIAGRQAWTGNSGGYITSVVSLPPMPAGQLFKLRFRMASDCSVAGTGWNIDAVSVIACTGTSTPTPTPGCPPVTEGFDDIQTLLPAGWFVQNNSQPVGVNSWFQGSTAVFPAQTGSASAYIAVNYNSGTGTAMLSDWLLTPPLLLQNGARLTFYTRTVDTPQFPDRLQVRLSTNGASLNVGTLATDVGDFTTLLLDINPNYTVSGYPNAWTQFSVPITLPAPAMGRLAFRYFVENGGPGGTNSDYVGIDTLQITGACSLAPTPTPTPTVPPTTPTPTPATPTPTPPGPTLTPSPTPSSPPVFVSPLFSTGIVGKLWIYQIEAIGAQSFDTGALPPGIQFDSFLRALTGTPSQSGSFSITLFASNTAGTTQTKIGLDVRDIPPTGPVITSSTSATGRVGQPFTFHVLTINGSPAAMLTATNLPPGLNADAVTGIISGTPTAEGSFGVTLTVTDGSLSTSSILQLTMISDPNRPVIISPDTATISVGQAFNYATRVQTNSSDKVEYTLLGNLPAGLGFDSATGVISGTYSPRPGISNTSPNGLDLTGGALVGSIQLFGTNSNGSGTIQLLFLSAPSGLVNISTRIQVGMDANVLIGGFIVTGNAPKVIITRGLGPSLNGSVTGALQDPTLELHSAAHPETVVSNDNWRDSQEEIIRNTGISPPNDLESAIVVALDPGNYTAILRGNGNTTGIGVVEVYDLGTASVNASSNAKLAQISTRGTVLTGNDVMIGGFIITGAVTRVIVRAIGPELNGVVPGALQDTVLELHDGSGSLLAQNDDWRSTQEQEIIDTGVPPTDNRESAIVANLNPGAYTGVVLGKDGTTGVALVEVYGLQPAGGLKGNAR